MQCAQRDKINLYYLHMYSLISMRLIYYFDTWAITWHGIVPVFLKICTDLQKICSIWAQNCFCYCFWTSLGTQLTQLFRNNNKINFPLICCKFLVKLCEYSEIQKQYDVKWWLNYRKYGSVPYSFSCTFKIFCSFCIYQIKKAFKVRHCTLNGSTLSHY